MLKYLLIFGALLFMSHPTVSAQSEAADFDRKGRTYGALQKRDSAIWAYNRAYDLYLAAGRDEAYVVAYNIGQNLLVARKANEALIWGDKIAAAAAKSEKKWYLLFADCLRYNVYSFRKDDRNAEALFAQIQEKAATIAASTATEKRLAIAIYHNIYGIMLRRNQMALAETYLKKSIEIDADLGETNTWLHGNMLRLELMFYIAVGKEREAVKLMPRLQAVVARLGDEGLYFQQQIYVAELSLAMAVGDTLKLQELEARHTKFYVARLGEHHSLTAGFYINMAVVYKDLWREIVGQGNPKIIPAIFKSKAYAEKALTALENNVERENERVHIAMVYRNMGFMLLENAEGNFALDSILAYFYKGYQVLLDEKEQSLPIGVFPDFNNTQIFTYDDFQANMVLQGICRTYQEYIKQGNDDNLPALLHALAARRALLNRNSNLMQNLGDIEKIEAALFELNNDCLNTYATLRKAQPNNRDYADSLLFYAEQTSAASTQRQLNIEEVFRQTNVPKDLATQYIDQRKEIQRLALARAAAWREKQPDLATSLNNQLLAAQLKMKQIDESLKLRVPDYANQILDIRAPTIKEIQAQLQPHTACYVPLNHWSSYIICKDTFFYTDEIDLKENYSQYEAAFQLLHAPNFEDANSMQAAKISYIKSAHFAYKHIFQKNDLLKARNIDHLIVVASRHANTIPFELLLCSPADSLANYGDFDYLLRYYAVQYVPSLSLLQKAKQIEKQTNNNGKILGYAPTYDKNTIIAKRKTSTVRYGLLPLAGARSEVNTLAAAYYGDYNLDTAAHESNFKAQLTQHYAVIHLAMHGLLDHEKPENSALAFSETADSTEDNFLYAHEIALLKANAQLVILSACETAAGKQARGEGTMSLARYFVFAGVPAIIATRWQVNDQTTAIIMEECYRNIYNGLPVHQALRQAQLLYLQHAKGKAQHPFFWAAYTNIGFTDRSIFIASKNWAIKYYIMAGLAGCLLLLIFGLRFRRKSALTN